MGILRRLWKSCHWNPKVQYPCCPRCELVFLCFEKYARGLSGWLFALCSPARSCDYTPTITPTRRAGSRFSTVQRHLRSDSRVGSSWPLTRERLLGAILVCDERPRFRIAHITTASGTVKKVIEINPYLLGTMAGGAGEPFPFIVLGVLSADLMFGCVV